ncbi:DUF3800 domain-containing protein [Cellulosimicrobium funkei]|nr:DUF3800 domain-containing protein [Cellulosimicrobium funkei]
MTNQTRDGDTGLGGEAVVGAPRGWVQMLLCYVDESSRKSPDAYYVGALVVDAGQVRAIEAGLNAVMNQLKAKQPSLASDAEFHGYDLFQGKDAWKGMPPHLLAWASQQAVESICNHQPWFGVHGVETDLLQKKYGNHAYEPHEVALSQLLMKVQKKLKHRGHEIMVLADEHHLAEDSRTRFTEMRNGAVKGLSDGALDLYLDTIYFGPSKNSRLLQAVDLLTYFRQRRRHETERHPQAIRRMRNINKSIDSVCHHEYLWKPS